MWDSHMCKQQVWMCIELYIVILCVNVISALSLTEAEKIVMRKKRRSNQCMALTTNTYNNWRLIYLSILSICLIIIINKLLFQFFSSIFISSLVFSCLHDDIWAKWTEIMATLTLKHPTILLIRFQCRVDSLSYSFYNNTCISTSLKIKVPSSIHSEGMLTSR